MHRTFRAAAALVACAGVFAGATTGAQAATLDVVLAGDSYTSGNGAGGPYASCTRSDKTWGQLYAANLRTKGITVNVNNVACAGGVLKDLDAQISAITPETDLVALTIGGNDVGFTSIVISCFTPVVFDPARCRDAITKGKAKVPQVQADSLASIQRAKAKLRPGAKIIVVSYPYLAQPKTYILRGLLNSFDAGKAVRELGDLGDQAIKAALASANAQGGPQVEFIPIKDLFLGHEPNQDPYAENKDSWVWEFNGVGAVGDIYHPKPAGHGAITKAVLRSAGAQADFGLAS
ncbi:MAG: SGNH/GDSL hydrolase family protein [Solirubrobacteraceae bacterium]|nr:SGNH/GDSL hydrolase family protein [Solirubrobacteraceae bacterium]